MCRLRCPYRLCARVPPSRRRPSTVGGFREGEGQQSLDGAANLVGVLDRFDRKRYGAQVTLHHRTACTDVKWAEDEVELTVQPTPARSFIRISTCLTCISNPKHLLAHRYISSPDHLLCTAPSRGSRYSEKAGKS